MGPSGCGKTSFLDIIGGVGGSGSGKLSGQLMVNGQALDHQELKKVFFYKNKSSFRLNTLSAIVFAIVVVVAFIHSLTHLCRT